MIGRDVPWPQRTWLSVEVPLAADEGEVERVGDEIRVRVARGSDVPLIVRHLMDRIASRDPSVERFRDERTGGWRTSAALMRLLVQHEYVTHVRELEMMLRTAIVESAGTFLDVTRSLLGATPAPSTSQAPNIDPADIPPDVIQAALDRHDGVREKVWRELGLSSRHVLSRLMKKHNLR